MTSFLMSPGWRRQQRLLFFVYDGTGLGHLRRVCRIAEALQGPCSCLIVTGHRAAAEIVPRQCEYVHLPSLDSLFPQKSEYWGQEPFLRLGWAEALAMRGAIIDGIIAGFAPDAVFTDFLPLGKGEEMRKVIEHHPAKKYFILRGILDSPENVRDEILSGYGETALEKNYDRILVTCDKRICDIVSEYGFGNSLGDKMIYTGYVSNEIPERVKLSARSERGVSATDKWVVCSAGGGKLGESLIAECEALARQHPSVQFDIVHGPRSARPWTADSVEMFQEGHIRHIRRTRHLDILHAACDVVICPGGYNSLVEALEGSARTICVPVQVQANDEQFIHCQRLNQFRPIQVVTELPLLRKVFEAALGERPNGPLPPIREALDFDGIRRIREIVLNDLSLSHFV